jgi:hypothetical protein
MDDLGRISQQFQTQALRAALNCQPLDDARRSRLQTYDHQWRAYRRLRFLAYALLAAWIPFGLGVASLRHIPSVRPLVLPILLLYMVLAVGIAGVRFTFWPCPRCGRPFSLTTFWWFKYFNSVCVHCGLPKWSPRDPDETKGDG